MTLFWDILLVLLALTGMEAFAYFAHKYIMHGWGWGWHKSHHEPRTGVFEKNDLYVLVFSLVVIGMFALGDAYYRPLMPIATGITLYGVIYTLFHDGLVHRRWPVRWQPKRGYLKRLMQAHRMHHAVHGREGAVSFGFLWASDVRQLKRQLREVQQKQAQQDQSGTV